MPRPDDERSGPAKHRQVACRVLDVAVRDVAEDPAGENDIGWHRGRVDIAYGGVSLSDFDPAQSGDRDRLTRCGDATRVELDEQRRDIGSPRMPGKRTDQIASFAGADADDTDGAGWRRGEAIADTPLYDAQPLRERAIGVVVLAVPGLVVADAR